MGALVDVRPIVAGCTAAGAELERVDQVDSAAAALILAAAHPPRRSGQLAAAGRTDGPRVVWAVAHALPVMFGTRRMRARPFAADAVTATADQVAELYTAHAAAAAAHL